VLAVLLVIGVAPVIGAATVRSRSVPQETPATILAIPTTTPQAEPTYCCSNSFSPLEALVLDSSGNPVSGVTVTFTDPSSGPSAYLASNNNTEQDITDAQGVAILSDASENGTNGTYQLTASALGVSTPAVFSLSNTSSAPDTLNPVLTTTPQSTEVGTAFVTDLQATLTDSSGEGVAGTPVTFTAYTGLESGLSGQASATFSGGLTTVTEDTDDEGVATAPSLTGNSTSGPFVVTASVADTYDPAVFNMTNLSAAPGTIIAVPTTTPQAEQSCNYCNHFSPLEALVLDSSGNPVSGVTVTFTDPSSGPSANLANNNTEQDITDAQGIATSSSASTNGTNGTYQLTASAPGVSTPAVFSLSNTSSAPDTLNPVLTTTPQSTEVGTAFATDLQATLTDSSGSAVAGVPVTFTAYTGLESGLSGQASATFSGDVTTVVEDTNSDGIATAPSLTANLMTGAFVVTASVPDTYEPAVFEMTNTDSSSTTLVLSSSNVTYGDEQVENVSVTVSPQYSGSTPTGTVTVKESNTTLCVTTLSSGKGSCTLSATQLDAGTYSLVATYSGSTDFGASSSAKETLSVGQATPSTPMISNLPASGTYGGSFTATVSTTGDGTTSVTSNSTSVCTVSNLVVSYVGVGTCSLTAHVAAGTDYSAADGTAQSFSVNPATPKTALKLSATKVTYGDEGVEHFSVTVSPQYSGTTATGTVTVKQSTTTLCVITLKSGKGSCTLSAEKLAVGTYGLVATYKGSTDFDGSASAKESVTVAKATSKTTLKLSAAKVTYGDEQIEHLSVTVSPQYSGTTATGTVTVKQSTTTLCVITLKSGKGSCTLSAEKLAVGTYGLVATYKGSTDFGGSASAKESVTVAKATSKTSLKLSAAKVTYGDGSVEHLSVTVSPQYSGTTATGTVTVKQSTTTPCVITLKSGKGSCTFPAKKLPAGAYSLVATYGGSANFKGSTSAKETLTVVK
jgi:hypothetical protein